jgi:hypothetical protein
MYSSGENWYLCFPPMISCVSNTMYAEKMKAPNHAYTTRRISLRTQIMMKPKIMRDQSKLKRTPEYSVKSIFVCKGNVEMQRLQKNP